jgi:hypothetical protein
MVCSVPFSGIILTTLFVLFTLAGGIVVAITWEAPSTARRSGIHPVVIIIIGVYYPIPFQWSDGEEVAWFEYPAAWRLNYFPEIIDRVPTKMLAAESNFALAG